MDWKAFKKNLPLGLDPVCLRGYLPKSKEMKALLLEGVKKFQEEVRLGMAPKSKKNQKKPSVKGTTKADSVVPATPPPAVRFCEEGRPDDSSCLNFYQLVV